ncbi:hypothetical protein SAMN02910358_00690 [Lachnospiraceae bacterium XBB1006]|nr:hypothetical protein SAMN02910358_00690 [Lachnospiraceae bacterium XBB1006]
MEKHFPDTVKGRERKLTSAIRGDRNRMSKEEKREVLKFIRKHDCTYCTENDGILKCFENRRCKCVKGDYSKTKVLKRCPRDEVGNCPYANETGTCFVVCFQKILQEFHEKEQK